MNIAEVMKASKIFHLCWIFVFLGSCTMIQTTDNRITVFSFQLADEDAKPVCGEFKRTVHLNHTRPRLPRIDITQLSPDDQLDVIMAVAEKVKAYMDNEEQYLREDIVRHNQKCAQPPSPVFQK